jgi:hypothetical protein
MSVPGGSKYIDGVNRPPPISTPREAPWKEIEAIVDGLANLSGQLTALITLLGGGAPLPAPPGAPPSAGTITIVIPHKRTITTGSLSIATVTPHTPVQLLPLSIQDGYPVTIIANPANAGNIYLGKSQNEVDDARYQFNGLAPGLAVSLKIKNLNAVWFDADNIGDGVSWIVETDV